MRSAKIIFIACWAVLIASPLSSQPAWWTEYALTDGSTRQDDAVATLGQAKHALQKGYSYLEAELSDIGGAGSEVTALYNTFCVTAPVNPQNDLNGLTLAQLKYLGKPIYDRLNSTEVGLDTSNMNPNSPDIYPWTVSQVDDADLALATIGQLKFVFSFDLTILNSTQDDHDGDGMLNDWENSNGLNPLDPSDAILDNDQDQLTNLEEFMLGTDPNNSDTDMDGLKDGSDAVSGQYPLKKDHPLISLQINTPLESVQ